MSNKINTDIWNDILLKSVDGYKFHNASTIKEPNKKYQVFEVLIAETLAYIQPEMDWHVTVGSSDGGVDLIAFSNNYYKNPFVNKVTEQLLLGQIKRRKSGYRYDEFRNDIISANDYYKSCYVSQGKSLLELLFVVSTEDKNNIKNLECNLSKSQKHRTPITLISAISSPVHIIDADEIIKYWKYNFSFVYNLISQFTTVEEKEIFKSFLDNVADTYVQISINEIGTANIGEIIEVPICIKTSSFNVPLNMTIVWKPFDCSSNVIQLVEPIELIQENGLTIEILSEYHLSLSFRAFQEGIWSLGYISIFAGKNCIIDNYPLGDVHFFRNIVPVFQISPNHAISERLLDSLTNTSLKYSCAIVTGNGGVGKSSLVNKTVILLENQGYACIKMEHLSSLMSNGDFSRNLICKLLSLQLHKPCFLDKAHENLICCLKGYYIKEWEEDIHKFLYTSEKFNTYIISSLFMALIIRNSMKHPLIIWLSNLHWLTEPDSTIIINLTQMLEINQNYLPFHVRLILEGRKNEVLIQNHMVYYPHVWENLQLKINAEKYSLQSWSIDDTRDFVKSLLASSKRRNDDYLYRELSQLLLKNFSGIPMHITEQIRYLLQQGNLGLDTEGQLYIKDSNWKNLFSSEIRELIQNRLLYFINKYPTFGSWLILYAKFSANSSKKLKQTICINIKNLNVLAEDIALDSEFFKLSDSTITFQHEYFAEILKNMKIADDSVANILLNWFLHQRNLSLGDLLCKVKLLQLMDYPDSDALIIDVKKIVSESHDDTVLLSAYSALTFVSDSYLEKHNLPIYFVNYQLGQLTMRFGNYKTAKEYLQNILDKHNSNKEYIYYCALAYQQLSNIASAKFELYEAIECGEKGINFIRNKRDQLQVYTKFDEVEIMLLSRQSVNYAFAGNWSTAMHYQKAAIRKALKLHNPYLSVRIAYERCGLLLHKSLISNINRLSILYKWAQSMEYMYPTELYFIKVMELVGRIILFQNDKIKIVEIQSEAKQLETILMNKKSNYIICLNCLVLGCCSLLIDGIIDTALPYFFKALEAGLDSYREEMLWKCYVTIAQLYHYNNEHKKALDYAHKAQKIIENILQNNSNQYDDLTKIYRLPIRIIKLMGIQKPIRMYSILPPFHILETLSIVWNGQVVFLMK